jgi:peptidyl-prolyl cis-trans isomerase SurA
MCHILLYPLYAVLKSQSENTDEMRDRIVQGDTTFADAARAISDEEQTSKNGVVL